ncbi:hypothetical protein ACJX0J_015394, partial [Zea mays]
MSFRVKDVTTDSGLLTLDFGGMGRFALGHFFNSIEDKSFSELALYSDKSMPHFVFVGPFILMIEMIGYFVFMQPVYDFDGVLLHLLFLELKFFWELKEIDRVVPEEFLKLL